MTDKIKEVLDKFFIMRVGTPDDDLEELKARNASGKPEEELAHQLNQMLIEARIEELEWQLAAIADKVKFKDWKWTIQSRLHELKAEKDK